MKDQTGETASDALLYDLKAEEICQFLRPLAYSVAVVAYYHE